MSSLQKEFSEVLALAKQFLEQTPQEESFVFSTPSNAQYFRELAKSMPITSDPVDRQRQSLQKNSFDSPAPPPPPPKAPVPEDPPKSQNFFHGKVKKEKSPKKESNPSKETGTHPFFKLVPVDAGPPDPLDDMMSAIKKYFPGIDVVETPPDDKLAHQIANKWKQVTGIPDIAILSYRDSPKEKEFLGNVAKAVSNQIAPSSVLSAVEIEHQDKWKKLLSAPNLKLVITNEKGMHSLSLMMKHHHLNNNNSRQYLGKVPILLLSSISLYLRDPSLKSSLWNAICHFKNEIM
ncbi:MAG: hypothetical protein ACI9S8_000308 [Chlamydiales bacterium]|jgi:hypothetical protein